MASWTAGRDSASVVDQTYGQRCVFGGVNEATAPVDEELEVEDEQDALDYLRLVRAEANKIPHVIVAAKQYGPQAFPPHLSDAGTSTLSPRQQRRRRHRHWDDQDDGRSAKKRRVSGQAAVPVELSYDDEGANEEEEEEGEEEEEPEEDRPDRQVYDNGVGDTRGYYSDGAYTAAPEDATASGTTAAAAAAAATATDTTFSTAFRVHLLARFTALRALLHQTPPPEAVDALPPDHDTAVGPLSTRSGAFRRGLHLLQTTDPLPAQVAAMDKVSALRLLRVLLRGLLMGSSSSSSSSSAAHSRSSRAGRFERRLLGTTARTKAGAGRLDLDARTSRWLWALFARLPARGELDYREIGYVRDVAKQAVLRLAHLSYDVGEEGEEEGEVHEGEGEEREEEGVVAEDLGEEDLDDVAMDMESEPDEPAGETTAETTDENAPDDADTDMQQRATLEMVLAVAGEFYGQRDLLAFRSPWPAGP